MENFTLATGCRERPFCADQPWLDPMVTHFRACKSDCSEKLLNGIWCNRLCYKITHDACAVERAEACEDNDSPPRLLEEHRCFACISNIRAVGKVHRRVTAFLSLCPLKKRLQFLGPLINKFDKLAAFNLMNYGIHTSPLKNTFPSSISPAVPRPVGRSSG